MVGQIREGGKVGRPFKPSRCFVAERYPFALDIALEAFEATAATRAPSDEAGIDAFRPVFQRELPGGVERVPCGGALARPPRAPPPPRELSRPVPSLSTRPTVCSDARRSRPR
jgi:hypothetical protein